MQTRTQLAVNTRGVTAGRLAADQLAASAQADAAQMMAAQDIARRQAERNAYMPGYLPPSPTYVRSSQDDGAGATGAPPTLYGGAPVYGPAYGQAPYGIPPYGSSAYGGGTLQTSAPPPSGGNAMGYTLPQATSH